jgi:hypothetical protein
MSLAELIISCHMKLLTRQTSSCTSRQAKSSLYGSSLFATYPSISPCGPLFISPDHTIDFASPEQVVLTLIKARDELYYIKKQEDFYQPEDALAFAIPGAWFGWVLFKHFATFICVLGAWFGLVIGWWAPSGVDALKEG